MKSLLPHNVLVRQAVHDTTNLNFLSQVTSLNKCIPKLGMLIYFGGFKCPIVLNKPWLHSINSLAYLSSDKTLT